MLAALHSLSKHVIPWELSVRLRVEYCRLRIRDRISRAEVALDAGCGEGLFLDALGKYSTRFVGADISTQDLKFAHSRTRNQANSSLVRCDLKMLAFRDQTFDLVLCVGVLEHLRNPSLALGELCRVMRPGAVLVAELPWLLDLIYLHRGILLRLRSFLKRSNLRFLRRGGNRNSIMDEPEPCPWHQTYMTPMAWQRLVEDAGLKVVMKTGIILWPLPFYWVSKFAKLDAILQQRVPGIITSLLGYDFHLVAKRF